MRYNTLVILAAVGLVGCGSVPKPEPAVRVVETKVPVPVACDSKLGQAPYFTDTKAAIEAAADFAARYQLLAANWALHYAWEAEQAAAIKGCSTP